VAVAEAHMATALLEALHNATEACEDPPLAEVLTLLSDLYALSELESAKGFFQEHGRLTGPRCKTITREVNRLCNEVRLQAGTLVDAFGIPDAILAAPIALRDPPHGSA
jgi:acyl-CoA oxidase